MLFPEITSSSSDKKSESYLVFARKYRPQNFDSLIGQQHLVDIFTNAFALDRIAHAYILTGVRGVGKTTTARILAKGLNCLASDKPTISPCGQCDNCISITAGKNMDVFEMDAASRTGINDIREIIDAIPYKPLTCRYKVYVIDEVHMLSTAAFNGLLKTLEEPPGHVKFIFATTEIHKIPATILSRCQRIDLKRIDTKMLSAFFEKILSLEGITADKTALAQIARASGGSVRDGLSLLDQAVSVGKNHVGDAIISDLLGSTHDDALLDIINYCLDYEPSNALKSFHQLIASGVDSILFSKEILKQIEWLLRMKFLPDMAQAEVFSDSYIEKCHTLIEKAEIHILSRMWEIGLQAVNDVKIAPDPNAVCEMALIRMIYGSQFPDPKMMFKRVVQEENTQNHHVMLEKNDDSIQETEEKKNLSALNDVLQTHTIVSCQSAKDISKILSQNKELELLSFWEINSIIHDFTEGHILLQSLLDKAITRKHIYHLKTFLQEHTKKDWDIKILEKDPAQLQAKTIFEIKKEEQNDLIISSKNDPIIRSVLEAFPGATISAIKENKKIEVMSLPHEDDLINLDANSNE